MGIDPMYNNTVFYNTWPNNNRENLGYTPTHSTGCHNYSEEAFPDSWFLPPSYDVANMLRMQINGEYDFGILPGQKFHSSRDAGNTSTRLYWIENGQIMSSEADGNKNEPAYVRCMRTRDYLSLP